MTTIAADDWLSAQESHNVLARKSPFQRPSDASSSLVACGWIEQLRRSKMRYVWKTVLMSVVKGRHVDEETVMLIQRETEGRLSMETLETIPIRWIRCVVPAEESEVGQNKFSLTVFNPKGIQEQDLNNNYVFRVYATQAYRSWISTLKAVQAHVERKEVAKITPEEDLLSFDESKTTTVLPSQPILQSHSHPPSGYVQPTAQLVPPQNQTQQYPSPPVSGQWQFQQPTHQYQSPQHFQQHLYQQHTNQPTNPAYTRQRPLHPCWKQPQYIGTTVGQQMSHSNRARAASAPTPPVGFHSYAAQHQESVSYQYQQTQHHQIPKPPASTGYVHQTSSAHPVYSPPVSGNTLEEAKPSQQQAGPLPESALRKRILVEWALEPPALQVLRPVQSLVSTIQTVFPPKFGVKPHDYFAKWSPAVNASKQLDKSIRKLRFFLHPDKLPKDFTEEQIFVCQLLWDVVNDAWEQHKKNNSC